MLCNIVDKRKRRHRWRKVNAIVEATEHDNANGDSDQVPEEEQGIAVTYEELVGVSVHEALQWASNFDGPTTLFLYDDGDGVGL